MVQKMAIVLCGLAKEFSSLRAHFGVRFLLPSADLSATLKTEYIIAGTNKYAVFEPPFWMDTDWEVSKWDARTAVEGRSIGGRGAVEGRSRGGRPADPFEKGQKKCSDFSLC